MIRTIPPAAWAVPAAWAAWLGLCWRVGRLPGPEAAAGALVVGLALGGARALAGTRGGLLGRAGELALLPGALAVLAAEPLAFRRVVALAVAWLAGGLAAAGAWRTTSRPGRLVPPLAAALGAGLLPGFVGAPLWPAKALLVAAALVVTAAALERVAGPAAAVLAAAALAASLGPAHTLPWAMPALAATAVLLVERDWPVAAALVAAPLPLVVTAGAAPAAGLLALAALRGRSARPLAAALPMLLALAARADGLPVPGGAAALAAALPLSATALPLLLPAVGLAAARPGRADRLAAVAVGLAALPAVGAGPGLAAAAACVWLPLVPALGPVLAGRAGRTTVPFTVAAALATLLLSPWGGALAPMTRQPWLLAAGWLGALALTASGRPVAALAWLLPAAGLVWTTPVEGVDRRLAAGERLELAGEVALMLRAADGVPGDGAPVADLPGSGPLLAGRDLPGGGVPPRHPLALAAGAGRGSVRGERGVATRRGVREIRARRALVVRWEPLGRWRARRRRLAALLAGAAALVALGLAVGRAPPVAAAGAAVLLAGTWTAASGAAPLARLGFRGAADAAALAALAGWWAVRPRIRRRWLAGAALLVPLALAQPALRHPAGDEVYHLALMRSLVQDHDLAVRDDLDPTDPAEAAYLADPRRFVHSPVLAVALAPGYAALGHAGALALLALAVAWAVGWAADRAERLGLGVRAAEAAWRLALLTYPALTFATQVWPAAAGALALALALAGAERSRPAGAALASAVAFAVKVRLALLAAPVAAVALVRRTSARAAAVAALALAAAAALTARSLGTPLGGHRLAELLPADPAAPLRGLWGLAWDAGGGLLLAAPAWLAALPWVRRLWRRAGAGERAAMVGLGLTLAALAPRGEWYGGGSPPARYLAAALPLAALALAAALGTARGRRLVGLAAVVGLPAAWLAATRPLALFNPVDGGSWLSDALARALDAAARRALPTMLRPGAAAWAAPAALLVLGAWWAWRPRRAAAAAGLVLLLSVATVTAALPEPVVEAEDPQVAHLGGRRDPPPGAFHPWSRGIAWRLEPGDAIEIPWDPPAGRRLVARARARGAVAALRLRWNGGPWEERRVPPGGWRLVAVPPPPGLGRHRLRVELAGPAEASLMVDRVEAGAHR